MKTNITFGTRLRMLLAERGWSQRDLANKIMFNYSTVSFWCSDTCEPKLTGIEALC